MDEITQSSLIMMSLIIGLYFFWKIPPAPPVPPAPSKKAVARKLFELKLVSLVDSANNNYNLITNRIDEINNLLKLASSDFTDRATPPFWDKIDEIQEKIETINKAVESIQESSRTYSRMYPNRLEDCSVDTKDIPDFPELISDFLMQRQSINEQTSIVIRSAMCDFQFATIYEQRKMQAGQRKIQAEVGQIGIAVENVKKSTKNSIDELEKNIKKGRSGVGVGFRF